MMSRSKKRLATSDLPKEEVWETVGVNSGPGMSALPREIVQMILSKLSHGNQLWARLVCKQWNELITDDAPSNPFLNKSVVRVCVNTSNRDIVLKNSVVKWKHLYLKDLRSSRQALPIIIPLHLRNNIQTVKISHANVTWKGFQQILVQFPSLRGLKISRSEITSMGSWKSMIHSTRQLEFESVLRGLSRLALSRLHHWTVHFLTDRFMANLPVLSTFELKFACWLLPYVFVHLMECVSPTIRNLRMSCVGRYPDRPMDSLFEVLRGLNQNEIVKAYLNLETLSLRYDGEDGPYLNHTTEDLTTLLEFLRMNKNLKRMCGLPENNSNLTIDLAREFIRGLSRDLVAIDVPGSTYLSVQGNLLLLFGKLECIQAGGDIRPFDLNLDGQVLPSVHAFQNCIIRDTLDAELTVRAFPNLVKLQARITDPLHSIGILGQISGHMKLLVSLDLAFGENCEIEDSGVTGISIPHCTFLQYRSLESLVSLKDDPIPEEQVTGVPLSCLPRLEKLTIRAHRMNISNVGLCFGFRFLCLKKLSLANIGFGGTCATRITPEGLRFIADYNRSLEEVSLHNIVRVNSDDVLGSEAIRNFQNRMDRCKSFRMKITPNPDPPQSMSSDEEDSSDDSDVSW